MPFTVTSAEELRQAKTRIGIAAYAREQRVLLRLLRKRGQFTEREFDQWFRGREWRRPLWALRSFPLHGEAFILGGLGQGHWAKWLDLLQHMMALDLIDAKTENGIVVYRRP